MSKDSFHLDKIEVRSQKTGKFDKYVIRGYALAPDIEHVYGHYKDKKGKVVKSFKSLFTKNAVDSVRQQLKHKKIYVDVEHELGAKLNIEHTLEQLKQEHPDVADQLSSIKSNLDMKKLPMFKFNHFDVRDDGLFVEVETNPYFPEVDESHQKYYDAITKSLLDEYINGFSINFKSTAVTNEDGVDKIDNLDIYGLSLVAGPALGANSGIVEVAMRSIMSKTVDGEQKMTEENSNENVGAAPKAAEVVPPTPQPEPKSGLPENITHMVQKQVEAELKRREMALQAEQQQAEYARMKQELEEMKTKQSSGLQDSKKGTVKQEGKSQYADPKWWEEKVSDLSWGELVQMQAEFQGRLPAVETVANHEAKGADPRVTTKVRPASGSYAEMQRALLGGDSDVSFTSVPRN